MAVMALLLCASDTCGLFDDSAACRFGPMWVP